MNTLYAIRDRKRGDYPYINYHESVCLFSEGFPRYTYKEIDDAMEDLTVIVAQDLQDGGDGDMEIVEITYTIKSL